MVRRQERFINTLYRHVIRACSVINWIQLKEMLEYCMLSAVIIGCLTSFNILHISTLSTLWTWLRESIFFIIRYTAR